MTPKSSHSNHASPGSPSQAMEKSTETLERLGLQDRAEGTERPTNYFDKLPTEILLGIIELFGTPKKDYHGERMKTLTRLSLVNHRLHELVEPFIYTAIEGEQATPALFLRTMITRPELGAKVKDLSISLCYRSGRRYLPTLDDKRIFEKGLEELAVPSWRQWASECSKDPRGQDGDDYDSLWATCMLYMPALTQLRVFQHQDRNNPRSAWLEVLAAAVHPPTSSRMHRFNNLKRIEISITKARLIDYLPLFLLSSLESLFSRAYETKAPAVTGPNNPWSLLHRPSPIQSLRLMGTMHTDIVVRIAEACPTLKKLDLVHSPYPYHFRADREDFMGFATFLQYPKLTQTLLRLRDTLEIVIFDESEEVPLKPWHRIAVQPLGSLRDMHKLKELTVPFAALVKMDVGAKAVTEEASDEALAVLPLSLERLEISRYVLKVEGSVEAAPVHRFLSKMLDVMDRKYPALKKIRLDPGDRYASDYTPYHPLIERFKNIGVELEHGGMEDDPSDDDYDDGYSDGFYEEEHEFYEDEHAFYEQHGFPATFRGDPWDNEPELWDEDDEGQERGGDGPNIAPVN